MTNATRIARAAAVLASLLGLAGAPALAKEPKKDDKSSATHAKPGKDAAKAPAGSNHPQITPKNAHSKPAQPSSRPKDT
jgi:hypothetical protein